MTKSKLSLPDLMYITGFMLILCALPIGIQSGFMVHHDLDDNKSWHWAKIAGAVMTITIGFIGGLLLCIAVFILKRRRKVKKEAINHDAT